MSIDTKELKKIDLPESQTDTTIKVTRCRMCHQPPEKLDSVRRVMEESDKYKTAADVIRAEEPTLQENGEFFCTRCFVAMSCPSWAYRQNIPELE